jgi:Ca2+-binding EF-hand superfamily protein
MTVLVGDLDINELTVLFFKMGMDLIPRRVQELMVQFDVDQGGSIEFNDYLLMLNAISKPTCTA